MGVAGGAHLESCANALQCLCDHGKMGAKLPETAYLEFSRQVPRRCNGYTYVEVGWLGRPKMSRDLDLKAARRRREIFLLGAKT